MNLTAIFKAVAQVAATKIVSGLIALGVSIGVVVPLDESSTLTATLTLAIAAALQLGWQALVAFLEKKFPRLRNVQPMVLRVLLRGNGTTAS